jgi:hypothetical protein
LQSQGSQDNWGLIAAILANWWWLSHVVVAVFGITAVAALFFYIRHGKSPWWFPVNQVLNFIARLLGF